MESFIIIASIILKVSLPQIYQNTDETKCIKEQLEKDPNKSD
uniref:Uncharacterized protein n=1 Tax=Heterorhabditis bacteriophora TaxID=37862 RepID=A0A1I7WKK2_HETBA